jgi:L-ascorbate metabolism protein UlaG (beta-lactamase superfamily)
MLNVEGEMEVRWLGWAGVEIECSGQSVVIDLLGDPLGVLAAVPEIAVQTLMPHVVAPKNTGSVLAGLCTHLHRDHADAKALVSALAPGAPVIHPAGFGGDDHENFWLLQAESELQSAGLERRSVSDWETLTVGPFEISALPAVDGIGDPQVSWVIEAEGRRVVHLGDTMFHGYWWRAARRFGPIDVVCTPINGPTLCFPHCQPPSPLAGALEPEQAALAGELLGASYVIPIHYGGFRVPEQYEPVPEDERRFLEATAGRPYEVHKLGPGESQDL